MAVDYVTTGAVCESKNREFSKIRKIRLNRLFHAPEAPPGRDGARRATARPRYGMSMPPFTLITWPVM